LNRCSGVIVERVAPQIYTESNEND